ncbi:MAG: VIT1/CCC1 family protein [Dehalococcoidales bacterium]
MLEQEVKEKILAVQRAEITEHFIYGRLAQSIKDSHNRGVLRRIANDELAHHNFWTKYSGESVRPNKFKIWLYYLISRILGMTFGIKLMEEGEEQAQKTYAEIAKFIPAAANIASDENRHERQLIGLIDEERLKYTADIVRGLNVALVELTGTLAGLTLALPEKSLIIIAGLIAGIVMVLSVASTEYLATKTGEGVRSPFKAVLYGGLTNAFTVLFLIFPYLIFANIYFALGLMVLNAIIVIFLFSFYISVATEIPFKKRFLEMVLISLGVAALAFVIGLLARTYLHIEI